ncbi:MAG: response regulator [Marinagarivorans sp.]|nr:response regulator [Marinagarivorans sp.]
MKSAAKNVTRYNKLSIKLVTAALVLGLFIAFIVSCIQITLLYIHETNTTTAIYKRIETEIIPRLSVSLWNVDANSVEELLDIVANTPNVGAVQLIDEDKHQQQRNIDKKGTVIHQQKFPIIFRENGEEVAMGSINIELVNTDILNQLWDRSLVISVTALASIFTGAVIMFFLFQIWVARHLNRMASYAKDLDIHNLDRVLHLDRPAHSKQDELDIVVRAINDMRETLQQDLAKQQAIEQELVNHKENLERLIENRTLALLSARDQLETAAKVAELGIWVWNFEDNSLQWNERMFDIFDQPASLANEGLSYQHWRMRVHEDDIVEVEKKLVEATKNLAPFETVYRVRNRHGDILHIQADAQVECNDAGKALRLTGVNRDITKAQKLEEYLRNAKTQADAASEMKSAFLANMSHEIRTPLSAVIGMLTLIQQTELTPRQLDYIVKAHGAAKSLLGLLNDILDFSKIDAGKLQLESHPFNLESLLRDLGVILTGNLGEKTIDVMFDIDPHIPHILTGDRLRLQQILINLAGNAIKFTQEGLVVIKLSLISRNPQNALLRIAVSDTGIGINPEQITRIFDGFVQAEASIARRFGGTGLGLVISKRLVELMGAELQLESTLGKGSCFWFDINFQLPLATQEPSTLIPSQALNVLIVDDQPLVANILALAASALGWHADQAFSGHEAINSVLAADAKQQAYDVVFMDWKMPDLDGLSAAQKIRDLATNSPAKIIVMATAYGKNMFTDTLSTQQSPFNDFLTKPVTPQQLVEVVERALSNPMVDSNDKLPAPLLAKPLAGIRILVVEDIEINRQIAFELLTSEGAIVDLAEGGLEGVTKATAQPQRYDIVIMDMQMPDIDGLEATRRIRSNTLFSALPILAMTANASNTDRDNCLAAGMNDHVGKPVDMDEVRPKILALLQRELMALTTSHQQAIHHQEKHEQATDSEEDITESLPMILKRFANNATLYSGMLQRLPKEMQKLMAALVSARTQTNINAAISTLHSIKGLAATMGAKNLAQLAAGLEKTLKENPPEQLQTALTDTFLADIEALSMLSQTQLFAKIAAETPQ